MVGLRRLSLWGNPGITENGAQTLLNGLTKNVHMLDLELFRTFDCSNLIYYYLTLNRGGRKLIQKRLMPPSCESQSKSIATTSCAATGSNTIPLALWPIVFERANTLNYTKRNFLTNTTVNSNTTVSERNANSRNESIVTQKQQNQITKYLGSYA